MTSFSVRVPKVLEATDKGTDTDWANLKNKVFCLNIQCSFCIPYNAIGLNNYIENCLGYISVRFRSTSFVEIVWLRRVDF